MKKINKNTINEDLNSLFEKLVNSRVKQLRTFEELRKKITDRLDREISALYAKKDLITDMWAKREELRLQRVSFLSKVMENSLVMNLRYLLSMPFIYGMFVPALVLHAGLELYHQVCFRLWGIARVKPSDYFIFDRRLLPYLNWFEKFNCIYCSYFNCLVSYTKEIAGRTEKYWCPIKHAKNIKDQHRHYDDFVDYTDGEALRRRWDELRKID